MCADTARLDLIGQLRGDPDAARALRQETKRLLSERAIELYEPYPKQQAFHAHGRIYRERLLLAGNQLGKELADVTEVLTPTGWVAIANLRSGDRVIGGDGKPCNVLGVYPQGVKPINRLTFDYGAVVDAGDEHLWLTQTPRARWKTQSSTRRDEAGKRFSVQIPNRAYGTWTVEKTRDMRRRYGDAPRPPDRHITPHVGVVEFDAQPVPIDPYLLGVLLGDGSLTAGGVVFSTPDAHILETVSACLPAGLSVKHRSKYDYAITGGQHGGADNPLLTALRLLGVMGSASNGKRVPSAYLWNTSTVRLAVLQGLMDTDGTCEKSGVTTFTTVSPGLAEDVAFLARSFGAKVHTTDRITHYTTPDGEKRPGQRAYTVVIRLPHVPLFMLDRKATRYIRPTSTTDHHVITDFKDAPPASATCIAVDSPDNTYVIEGFIVTHNTFSAGAECSFHLTGEYPAWWQGRRFNDAVAGWAIGVSSELTRDSCQRVLFGRASAPGTGLVPRRLIKNTTSARGVSDALDTVSVQHVNGGVSTIGFKSYQQDRTKLQAETLQFVWLDEEPPYDIYSEAVTRTNATGGIVMMTFTPLEGMSEVVRLFYPKPTSQDRVLVQMTLDDAGHFTEEQKRRVTQFYKPHEREARTRGIPQLGSGAIFAVPESAYTIEAFATPRYWQKIIGIDLGYDHPFGAALLNYDREADTVYVTQAISASGKTVSQQADMIRSWGNGIPVAWPHDASSHDRTSAEPMAEIYRRHGLQMLFEHATHKDGGFGLEASIADMIDRLESGRLKIFNHLSDCLEEMRNYHRKEGRVVKQHDDIISAIRYGLMMLRFARLPPSSRNGPVKRGLRVV